MKVLADLNDSPKTGKGFFLQKLVQELRNQGIDVTTSGKHDIYLAVNVFKRKTRAPKVLRVNGVYNDKQRPYKRMNEAIATQCRKADGIVYQSQWAKQMHCKYVGKYKVPTAVILNGAIIQKPSPVDSLRFCAVARWRPHKRLADIQKAFELANIPGSTLWIANNVSHEAVLEAIRGSVALIHLCWQDACPNSVVESLSVGTPVITNNVGGTQELIIDGCGEVCEIDEPYNMKPVKLYKPPLIDHKVVAEAMTDAVKWPRVTNNAHVDSKNTAAQYRRCFKEVLNG